MTEEEPPAPEEARPELRKRGGCLWRLIVLTLLSILLLFLALDYVFNLRSNAIYAAFRDSTAPLEAQLSNGTWKPLSTITIGELDRALVTQDETAGATWKTLSVRRQPRDLKQRAAQGIFDSQISVIEMSPEYFMFSTSFKEHFTPTTARERLKSEDAAFAITANFREPNGKPLGLVVHEGRQVNSQFPNWTGYFFVKAGKPWFGPKTLFQETPGVLQEASQGYPSLMRDHTVFSYVDLAPNKFFDGNRITYRSLGGVRQDGKVVFILSGNGGVMNVAEVTALAQKLRVQHATLLDGGRALQYSVKFGGLSHHFNAFNTILDVDWQGCEPERSPVFIVAKPLQQP